MPSIDRETIVIVAAVVAFLILSSVVAWILSRHIQSPGAQATLRNLTARIRAWWVMVAVFALALFTGKTGSVVLFGITSFLALREFITLTPTRGGDHRALLWLFFVVTPIQYVLIHQGWYGLFSVFIPVYAFLLLPARAAAAGECDRFLERTAKVQWGLMLCVYCVSHAPALLLLEIPGYEGQNSKLLLYLVLVVQMSDVLQYIWGKTLGRTTIAPSVSPNKTVAGFFGGTASATALGTALWWATPFTPSQAAGMALTITLMGFFGGLVMSAIKRDRGIKDYGSLIEGHGGILDRIDSICFAAPVFFHLTRYFCT